MTIKPTDDLESGSSESGENAERELTNAELTVMINGQHDEARTLLIEQGGQTVRDIESSLHYLLGQLLRRCKRDPEVFTLLHQFIGKLQSLSGFGNGANQMSTAHLEELRSVLVGATMIATPGRERMQSEIYPMNHVHDAHGFLDLVEKRVGNKVDDDTVTLKMRISEDQSGNKITHHRKQ